MVMGSLPAAAALCCTAFWNITLCEGAGAEGEEANDPHSREARTPDVGGAVELHETQ